MSDNQQYDGIIYDLENQEYRDAPGISSTLLKGIVSKSVKHALTTKPRTKSLDTGLRLHEFILERDKFLSNYVQGLNPEDHHDALTSTDQLREAIDWTNETRKPKLSKTGNRDSLLESIISDDTNHMQGVADVSSLSVTDLKNRIDFINSAPDRGIISKSGTAKQLTEKLREAGFKGEIWSEITEQLESASGDRTVLQYDEYQKYDDMYQSLITHLKEGADKDDRLFQWLLYAFTTPDVMKTEVSMFSNGSKCRFDGIFKAGDRYVGLDLKSTQDASDSGFERLAARYGYDIQEAHYTETARGCDCDIMSFAFITIETEKPYGVNVFVSDDTFKEVGHKKRQWAINQYNKYVASGSKTAYSAHSKTLSLPVWSIGGPWDE